MDMYKNIIDHLGDNAYYYLDHVSKKIPKDKLQLPSNDSIDRVFVNSNRKL